MGKEEIQMKRRGTLLILFFVLSALLTAGCGGAPSSQTSTTPAPAPTIAVVATDEGASITRDQFDALAVPVAVIADLFNTAQMPYPDNTVPPEYANAYLFHYANAALYERRETFDGLQDTDFDEYVALTPEEVNTIFLTAFNGRVDTTNFMPNETSCIYNANMFYVGIDKDDAVSAQYAGQAPAAYSPSADYLYTASFIADDGTKQVASFAVRLAANEGAETGYCITRATAE